MNPGSKGVPNVKQVVPFLRVSDMERSLRYYVDGLGFEMKNKWVVDEKVRWCWLELGGAALMLQEFQVGGGVSLNFICENAIAIYRDARTREIQASAPQVGNGMWETGLTDPDGFRLFFESPTDKPEDTLLSEVETN